ncbi:MAG: glyoxalase/bleomycin resistance/extradiol dioxygenase family protein [Hyphomicrobiaceae bacterium]|nr:glyoxalase/bleomycin resistance/extradiol dioxygenase family protein [Hyphomicrobiaceae bacterium]
MTPTPYLFFNGNCAEAIASYVEIFGGEIMEKMPASDMPPEYDVPDENRHLVMHSRIRIGDGFLMASDNLMGENTEMTGSSVLVSLPTVDAGKAAFDTLADGGAIEMPYGPTFWSKGFGMLTDRFGVRWMIGCDEVPEEG